MNNLHITLSRFLYAPHSLPELIGAIFGWMALLGVPAMLWILIETMLTPAYQYWNPEHKMTLGFWLSWLYMGILTVAFVVYCVVPMYVPAMAKFLELKNYQ